MIVFLIFNTSRCIPIYKVKSNHRKDGPKKVSRLNTLKNGESKEGMCYLAFLDLSSTFDKVGEMDCSN